MFETRIPTRWSDLDAQGHVNNGAYLDYLQETRVEFLHGSPAQSLLDEGVVVVRHQLEYQRPISYHDQPLAVRMVVASLGAARFELAYDIHDQGELALRARTTCCPFDFITQRPRRLRPAERGRLEASLFDVPPLAELPRPALGGAGHAYPLKVRWSDQDQYRHVNNVLTCDFFQEARLQLMLASQQVRPPGQDEQYLWFMVRQDLNYVGQIDYRPEPYCIRTAITKIGTTSFTAHAELRDSADPASPLLASNQAVLVCGDVRTGRPVSLTDGMRTGLEGFRVAV